MEMVSKIVTEESDNFDIEATQMVFESKCSQCHSIDLPLQKQFASADEVPTLVTRMVGNGLVASEGELESIVRFLIHHHKLN